MPEYAATKTIIVALVALVVYYGPGRQRMTIEFTDEEVRHLICAILDRQLVARTQRDQLVLSRALKKLKEAQE